VTAPRPRVVVHVAVSLDGATTGFDPDVGRFYELARTWDEDVTLAGADTILAQESALAGARRPGPAVDGPLLAVVDSRERIRQWDALRECGHWSDVLALRAPAAGERVDLAAALDALGERGAGVVRVDSGGELTGALLRRSLVDEVSLLVHPCLACSGTRWHGSKRVPAQRFELLGNEPIAGDLMWMRYAVLPADASS
jgi:2,5-diamino-6-(ribosylamino)-4(3H)-pyrimidinone 5'-phosphate reductase